MLTAKAVSQRTSKSAQQTFLTQENAQKVGILRTNLRYRKMELRRIGMKWVMKK